jgi:hypothetical protein
LSLAAPSRLFSSRERSILILPRIARSIADRQVFSCPVRVTLYPSRCGLSRKARRGYRQPEVSRPGAAKAFALGFLPGLLPGSFPVLPPGLCGVIRRYFAEGPSEPGVRLQKSETIDDAP